MRSQRSRDTPRGFCGVHSCGVTSPGRNADRGHWHNYYVQSVRAEDGAVNEHGKQRQGGQLRTDRRLPELRDHNPTPTRSISQHRRATDFWGAWVWLQDSRKEARTVERSEHSERGGRHRCPVLLLHGRLYRPPTTPWSVIGLPSAATITSRVSGDWLLCLLLLVFSITTSLACITSLFALQSVFSKTILLFSKVLPLKSSTVCYYIVNFIT